MNNLAFISAKNSDDPNPIPWRASLLALGCAAAPKIPNSLKSFAGKPRSYRTESAFSLNRSSFSPPQRQRAPFGALSQTGGLSSPFTCLALRQLVTQDPQSLTSPFREHWRLFALRPTQVLACNFSPNALTTFRMVPNSGFPSPDKAR